MNTRIIRALVWEQFRKTYVLWLCALGISVLGSLGAYLIVQVDPASFAEAAFVATKSTYRTLLGGLLLYVLGILYLQDGANDLQLLIPPGQLRRPVSTAVLVACRYFYDVLSAGALALCALAVIYVLLPADVSRYFDVGRIVLIVLGATASARTIAWIFGGLGLPGVAIFGVLAYLAFGLAAIAFLNDFQRNLPNTAVLSVAAIGAGYGLCVMAVSRQRSGRHLSWAPLWALLARRGVRGSAPLAPFAGPEDAVRWFERRRQSYLFSGILAVSYALYFAPFSLYVAYHNYGGLHFSRLTYAGIYLDAALLGLLQAVGCATLVTGGFYLLMNRRLYHAAAGRFIYTRPVATGVLAQARLQTTATRVLLALVPLVALGLVVLEVDHRIEESMLLNRLLPTYGMLGTMLLFTLAFLGIVGASWGGIWMAHVIAVAVAYLIFSALLDVLGGPFWDRDETALLLCLVGCVCALGWLALQCRRRGLLDRRVVVQGIVTVTVLGLAYPLLYNFGRVEAGTIVHFGWEWSWGMPVAIAVAVAPFLTVPLSMDWARHR